MTDLATALRHELDRLPRHDRARMVHASSNSTPTSWTGS